jgi:hypothetical protein
LFCFFFLPKQFEEGEGKDEEGKSAWQKAVAKKAGSLQRSKHELLTVRV